MIVELNNKLSPGPYRGCLLSYLVSWYFSCLHALNGPFGRLTRRFRAHNRFTYPVVHISGFPLSFMPESV